MLAIKSDNHRKHFPRGELCGGELVRPFECPERWDYIVNALNQRDMIEWLEPDPVSMSVIEQIHKPDYLEFLQNAWQEWTETGFTGDAILTVYPARRMQQRVPQFIDGKMGYYAMAVETAITAGTWEAALSSAACAQTAQRLVSEGASSAFALCRPPGHHSASDLYGGYCFLNNAALAAQGFRLQGADRVSILDIDFHHGNGTQDIFYDRDDVQYISLHGAPEHAFPHFLGYADETGKGQGEGFNINYPMQPETPYAVWSQALDDACKQITAYKPDVLVVSLGVDTFEKDPISFFKLKEDDFSDCGRRVAALNLPVVFIMEGGYAVEEIGINVANVLQGFSEGV